MSVRLLLCFAVLVAVKADSGSISFWFKNAILTCPGQGTWYKDGTELQGVAVGKTYTFEYENKKKGLYHCSDDNNNNKYYFYVQGKVCDNCFELDGVFWGSIIAADMVLTMVVMTIVYKCTKKRNAGGRPHTPKAGAPPGGRAPPIPSPDYEPLNPQTTSHGTYAGLNANRVG